MDNAWAERKPHGAVALAARPECPYEYAYDWRDGLGR